MILTDFTMLGRTEPTESKKHGVCVCSAGYSRELRQLVRIYPLPWPNSIRMWSRCTVPLRRPKDDNRVESWRIDAPDDDADTAESAVHIHSRADKDSEFDFLASISVSGVKEMNEERRSLAIVKPRYLRGFFDRRIDVDPAEQITMFERREHEGVAHRSDLIPRLQFMDDSGNMSKLSLKEWGCSEWLRKNREDADLLWNNLSIGDPTYEHLLFIGNQNHQRTSWLVISVIRRRISSQLSLIA